MSKQQHITRDSKILSMWLLHENTRTTYTLFGWGATATVHHELPQFSQPEQLVKFL